MLRFSEISKRIFVVLCTASFLCFSTSALADENSGLGEGPSEGRAQPARRSVTIPSSLQSQILPISSGQVSPHGKYDQITIITPAQAVAPIVAPSSEPEEEKSARPDLKVLDPAKVEVIGELGTAQTADRIEAIVESSAPEYAQVKGILDKFTISFNRWAEKNGQRIGKDANFVLAVITGVTSSGIVIFSQATAHFSKSGLPANLESLFASIHWGSIGISTSMVATTFLFESVVQLKSRQYVDWVIAKEWVYNFTEAKGSVANSIAKRFAFSMIFAGGLNAFAYHSGTVAGDPLYLVGRTMLEGLTYVLTTHYYFEYFKNQKKKAVLPVKVLNRNGQLTNFIVTSAANLALLTSKLPAEVFGHAFPERIQELSGSDPNLLTASISAALLGRGAFLYYKDSINAQVASIKNFCKAAFSRFN